MRAKEWYQKNREKALDNVKKYSKTKKAVDYSKNYRVLNKEKISARHKKWYESNKVNQVAKAKVWKQKNPIRSQFLRYQERAKLKESTFSLEYEEFEEAVNMPCVYCGFNDGIVGIDRIDSSIGYKRDNIVPCCKVCNYMKLDHSVEEWFSAMEEIFNNLGYEVTRSTKKDS